MCVSSKILALSHFFFDLVKFGNTWCVVRCCPRSPSSIFPACVSKRLLSRTVTPTLYSQALYFYSPFRDLVRTSPDHPYLPPYPDRHHLRCRPRKDRIRHPMLHPYPDPCHPLSAPDLLISFHRASVLTPPRRAVTNLHAPQVKQFPFHFVLCYSRLPFAIWTALPVAPHPENSSKLPTK